MATKKQVPAVVAPAEAAAKALKGMDELVAVGKGNLEAVVKANTAAVAGAKRLNTELAAYVRAAYEANLAAARALAGVKTVQEAIELQNGHVRATVETAIAKGNELSEVALTVANDVAEPLQARAKVTFDKLMTQVAA